MPIWKGAWCETGVALACVAFVVCIMQCLDWIREVQKQTLVDPVTEIHNLVRDKTMRVVKKICL